MMWRNLSFGLLSRLIQIIVSFFTIGMAMKAIGPANRPRIQARSRGAAGAGDEAERVAVVIVIEA